MRNMEQIIKSHNNSLMQNTNTTPQRLCICARAPCPLNGRCLTQNIVYKAQVTTIVPNTTNETTNGTNQDAQPNPTNENHNVNPSQTRTTHELTPDSRKIEKIYIGASEKFKERFRNHTKSFRHRIYASETELSKYIWELKDKNIDFEIKWDILKRTNGYNKISKSCSLCLMEKFMICNYKHKDKLLNKRSELVSKCRHVNKHLLKYFH